MTRSPRIRRAVLRTGAFVLLLASAELVARLLVPGPVRDPCRLFRVLGADGYAEVEPQQGGRVLVQDLEALLVADPVRMWRLRPDLDLVATRLSPGGRRAWTLHTSADGFRGRPLADRPEGEVRILVVGDDTSFGWEVQDDEAWPAVLEADLGDGWQVINLSVPGYSSLQGASLVEELGPQLHPDIVIAAFGSADGHQVLRGDAALLRAPRSTLAEPVEAFRAQRTVQLGRLLLFRPWAQGVVLGWRSGLLRPRVRPAELEEAIEDISDQAPQTVLVDVCGRPAHQAVLAHLAQVRPDVDLVSYRGIHGETIDGCHPTPEGHRALAAAVRRLVE